MTNEPLIDYLPRFSLRVFLVAITLAVALLALSLHMYRLNTDMHYRMCRDLGLPSSPETMIRYALRPVGNDKGSRSRG